MQPRLLLVAAFLALLVLPEATKAEKGSLWEKMKAYVKDVVQKTVDDLKSPPQPYLTLPGFLTSRDWMTERFRFMTG